MIWGNDMHLQIPARNSWKIIEVHACGALSLDFEDLPAFVRTAPAFTFEFIAPKEVELCEIYGTLMRNEDVRSELYGFFSPLRSLRWVLVQSH